MQKISVTMLAVSEESLIYSPSFSKNVRAEQGGVDLILRKRCYNFSIVKKPKNTRNTTRKYVNSLNFTTAFGVSKHPIAYVILRNMFPSSSLQISNAFTIRTDPLRFGSSPSSFNLINF